MHWLKLFFIDHKYGIWCTILSLFICVIRAASDKMPAWMLTRNSLIRSSGFALFSFRCPFGRQLVFTILVHLPQFYILMACSFNLQHLFYTNLYSQQTQRCQPFQYLRNCSIFQGQFPHYDFGRQNSSK